MEKCKTMTEKSKKVKKQKDVTPQIRTATVLFTKNRIPAQTIIDYCLTAEKNNMDILILGTVDENDKEIHTLEIIMPKYAQPAPLLPTAKR